MPLSNRLSETAVSRRVCRPNLLRLALLSLGLLSGSPSFALSLPQAQQQLQSQSWDLKAHQFETQAWQQQAAATSSLGLPRIDITVAGIAYGKQIDIGQDLPVPIPLTLDIQREGIRSQLNVTWPLGTGGKIAATQAQAQAKVSEAQSDLLMTEAKLNKNLIDRYFAVQLSQQALQVMQQAATNLEAHVYKAKRFEQQGMISRLSRIQAEVARDGVKRDLIQAQANQTILRSALAGMLDLPEAQLGCLSTPLPIPQALPHPMAWYVAQAAQFNPAFGKLTAKSSQAEQQLKIEQSAFKPEIFAVGRYELNRQATPLTEPDWSVGVGAKWALTSGLDRHSMVSAAESRQQQVTALTAQTQADIRLGVQQAYQKISQYQQQYQLLNQDLVLAAESLRLQNKSFEAGLSTSLDVTDAQLGVARGEVQRAQASYDYVQALSSLYELTGALQQLDSLSQYLALTEQSCGA